MGGLIDFITYLLIGLSISIILFIVLLSILYCIMILEEKRDWVNNSKKLDVIA